MTTITPKTRLDMRIYPDIKDMATRASALKGYSSLTEYVSQLIEKDANETIKRYANFQVSGECFNQFVEACENADQPNEALQRAAARAEELGIS